MSKKKNMNSSKTPFLGIYPVRGVGGIIKTLRWEYYWLKDRTLTVVLTAGTFSMPTSYQ